MGPFHGICGKVCPNEDFGDPGERAHVSTKCRRMPHEGRDRIERLEELHAFLHQSVISAKNLERITVLCGHAIPEVAALAALLLDIACVFPRKRNRWLKLASQRPELLERALIVLGAGFFEDLLSGYGDFESPLWAMLEQRRIAPPWTNRPCDCGSGRSFRDCCLERENALVDEANADAGEGLPARQTSNEAPEVD